MATARDLSKIEQIAVQFPETFLPVMLDVNWHDQIALAVGDAIGRFGAIDVLVNNAGYGYMSSVEEGEEREIRRQFETNVFGLFAMIRAVLPHMRRSRRGHIINMSSVAGLVGFPGSGYYAASKHAVEGLSDALAAEVAPLGIRVTCIEPGPFRTDWAGRSMTQTETRIEDYDQTAGQRLRGAKERSGAQPGDPTRAAAAIMSIAGRQDAPRHLVLGSFGVERVTQRLQLTLRDVENWRETAIGTDFPTLPGGAA